jgi:hypothetical protein
VFILGYNDYNNELLSFKEGITRSEAINFVKFDYLKFLKVFFQFCSVAAIKILPYGVFFQSVKSYIGSKY